MRKKYRITLIELVFSIGLLSIFIFFLTDYLKKSTHLSARVESAKKTVLDKHRFIKQIKDLFTTTEKAKSLLSKTHKSCFYTQVNEDTNAQELYFAIDNTLDKDKAFCGVCFAKIALVQEQVLLTIWPNDKHHSTPCRETILLNNVDSLEWKFCKISQNLPLDKQSSWDKANDNLPQFLEACVKTKQLGSFTVPIFLSSKIQEISYEL